MKRNVVDWLALVFVFLVFPSPAQERNRSYGLHPLGISSFSANAFTYGLKEIA